MQSNEIIKALSELAQLDIDAIHAYDSAIKNVDIQYVRSQLEGFREDHHRHVKDLSDVILRLGGTPPKFSPDFKGFLIQGFTAIRSATGNEGALKAMKSNEEVTNKAYSKAVGLGLPADVEAIVRKNFSDEQRHLTAIKGWIDTQVWEQAGAHP